MPPAWIIQVVAGKFRTPVGKNPDETPAGNVCLGLILGQIGETESSQRRIEPQRDVVEHELPFDMDVDFASVFLELPRVDAAVSRKPQIDAVVAREILRPLWPRTLGEIGRRGDHCPAHVGPDPNGDHVLGNLFAPALWRLQ